MNIVEWGYNHGKWIYDSVITRLVFDRTIPSKVTRLPAKHAAINTNELFLQLESSVQWHTLTMPKTGPTRPLTSV